MLPSGRVMRYSISYSPPCSNMCCTTCFTRSESPGCTTSRNRSNVTGSESAKPNNCLHFSVTQRSSPPGMFHTHRPRFAALAARLMLASLSRSASPARPRSAMPAENAIAVMVTTAVQDCRARSDWFSVSPTNGPKPCSVPQIATDNCANHCCERELNKPLRTIEDGCAAGEPIHQPGTAHSFERVAAGGGERCGDIARSGNVHQKCTDKNCRPGSVTEHEQCRERNSRWRPHRRCTRVQRCQHQSELAGDEVDKR